MSVGEYQCDMPTCSNHGVVYGQCIECAPESWLREALEEDPPILDDEQQERVKAMLADDESRSVDPEDLPLSTREPVLGAHIDVKQRDTYTHEYKGHTTRESAVDVEPMGERALVDQRDRKYLAKWARRNLYGGQP